MSMNTFHTAYDKTIGYEGGYSKDPKDPGGETYRGISRKNWPHWEGWKIIDQYTKRYKGKELVQKMEANGGLTNLVKDFYLENYWIPLSLDALHDAIAIEMFDTAVNQGKHAVATYLQQSLNKLNRNQEDYPDLTVDGKIGPATLRAYKSYMATQRFASRNSEKLIRWLIKWLNYYQLKKYDLITYRDPSLEIYIPGWTERA